MLYHAYLMASALGVFYAGMTNNLQRRRVAQHKSKQIGGFSSDYNTTKLTYFKPCSDPRDAIRVKNNARVGAEQAKLH